MYVDRKRLEEIEALALAPYALHSAESKGRLYPEDEPQYRTAFQRDRDRIIHSAAFRRLEYKTQVFVNDMGDYYRTRLTHTLEVAQIGRTLARALGANEDLVETICLAHDLGHPPFGHAGEHVLNRLMAAHGGFDHNHQSYRVVTELERRYARWHGLNLTQETLDGILSHSARQAPWGSLEAQIADAADELAYNAHDLDDGLKSGLVVLEQVQPLALWQHVVEQSRWDGHTFDDLTRHHIIRELVGVLIDDFIDSTAARLAEFAPKSSAEVQTLPRVVVGFSPKVAEMNAALKVFLNEVMYHHYRVMRMGQRAEHFLSQLFESYIREPRQLPPEYQVGLAQQGAPRVVADYLASLTDRSALLEYRRLFDPSMRP